jgi:hypothetical protein
MHSKPHPETQEPGTAHMLLLLLLLLGHRMCTA